MSEMRDLCKEHFQRGHSSKGNWRNSQTDLSQSTRDSHARVAEIVDDMKRVLTTCHVIADKNDDQWLLGTGCSIHFSGNKELFSNLDESFYSIVKIGDNLKLQVLGKVKIAFRLKDGSLNYISDVFYVPSICQNLLSVGQLAEEGYDLNFNKRGCTINDAEMGLIVKTSMSMNRLFLINIKFCSRLLVLWSNSVLFIYFEDKLTHRYYTRANSAGPMDHLEQENCELKEEVARLSALMESFLAAQSQSSPTPSTPP
ncbi:hypothetical protein KIW84_041119 [Lathyrus oleraceus]|uniref:Retrovirus-related Pol polyprotein from transposon TNT 1-94-like beta-barrel domain-containing protein n=1 Tax=Pisum sativum TaxID=3888 RepID=A0A9D4XBW0_PEA|nr:hypothetical protein KIW84_041119 [Pisum sativum]